MTQTQTIQMQEPTFGDVVRDLWGARRALAAGAVLGLVAGFIFVSLAVPHYRASLMVAPAERRAGPDIKALLPDNSSFAMQYLVNTLGSQDSGDYMRFENTLREPAVAARLLEDPRIVAGVAGDRRFSLMPERRDARSPEVFSAYLTKRVAIEPVGNSPLRRLVYTHPDRVFASYLLAALHGAADGLIRQEIRDKTESRATYLKEELAKTTHPDHRRALTSLVMEQEHVRMILAMDEPFAAIIAEPPSSGVQPHWPRKPFVLPLFVLAGMVAGYVMLKLRETLRSARP